MNKNVKKWLRALRSGEYKQGQQRLRDVDRFCCLGVACDLYHKETGKGKWKLRDGVDTFITHNGKNGKNYTILPIEVMDWLDLNDCAGSFINSRKKGQSLAHYNDTGRSFKQIANIIERSWKYMRNSSEKE